MSQLIDRRTALYAAGLAASALAGTALAQNDAPASKLIAISTSFRKGKTTAAALELCLQAAQEQMPGLQAELIELADLAIPGCVAAGIPLKPGESDDFPALIEKLAAPEVRGVIVGSPVYFGGMSSLCKAFLERCYALRKDGFKWSGKLAGALAVGSTRNGGQELTVQSIHTALMGQDMVIVGTGQPSVRIGPTLWNQDDSIEGDTFGIGTAKDLGRHMARLAEQAKAGG